MAGTAAMNAETRKILADTNTREAAIVILSPITIIPLSMEPVIPASGSPETRRLL